MIIKKLYCNNNLSNTIGTIVSKGYLAEEKLHKLNRL